MDFTSANKTTGTVKPGRENMKFSDKAIVNVSSQASFFALQNHTSYCMSKFALDGLTKMSCLELSQEFGIRVNSVNPTVVMTEMGRKAWGPPEKGGPMLAKIPLGRFAEEVEVVRPIFWLLNQKESGMVNGHCVPVEGGILSSCKM